jgi:hypothetical protein
MEQLGQGCDILVATMGRLNQFVREEKVNKKGKHIGKFLFEISIFFVGEVEQFGIFGVGRGGPFGQR